MLPVELSSQGLERAAAFGDDGFKFIGRGFELECTQFQAAFISPRVHLLLQEDRTVNSLFIETKTDEIDGPRIIELLRELINGVSIVPDPAHYPSLFELAAFLGNTELLNQLTDDIKIESETVCSRLRKGYSCGQSIDEAITFAASHLYELDFEEIALLDLSLIESIVSSPALRLKDENSLLELIRMVDCDGPILHRYLCSEYLTGEHMTAFLDFLSCSDLDPLIWSSVSGRLLLPSLPGKSDDSSIARATFVNRDLVLMSPNPSLGAELWMQEPKLLDGIISHLAKKHGGNVHEKRIVTISSKSIRSGSLKNVADVTSESFLDSNDEPSQWISWDFQKMVVQLTCYTIKSACLKSWIVEGSVDGKNWTEIDRETNNRHFDLRAWDYWPGAGIGAFPVSNRAGFRFIRLMQTGKNHYGNDALSLRAVEFFGTLCE
jgi:hypothetical protein